MDLAPTRPLTDSRAKRLSELVNSRPVTPRPYQARICDKVNLGWKEGLVSQMIVSPTGSGKTVMGLQCAMEYVAKSRDLHQVEPEEVGVVWVAMRVNLLDQTEESDYELFLDETKEMAHLVPNLHFVSMFDKSPMETIGKNYKYILMVVDEAHHDAASSMINIHTTVRPKNVLGLSATPQRSDSLKLCFQRQIQDAGYQALISDGYLAQFNHWACREYSPSSIARLYFRNPEKWGKSLAFFLKRSECEEFAGYIRNPQLLGINAEPRRIEVVHGGSNRSDQLGRFESGDLDLIVSMSILTEGFDCPSLHTVFIRDARSKGVTQQMGGRVLRKWGDAIKNIVQSSQTKYPFTRFAKPHQQFLEDETGRWGSVGVNDRVEQEMASAQEALQNYQPVNFPAFFQKKKLKTIQPPKQPKQPKQPK